MEYSAKYRVSLSTLRRRIKAGEIEFKLTDGKYLLRDGPLQVVNSGSETIAPPTSVKSPNQVPAPAVAPVDNDQFWKATQGLLNEIKKAYSLVLQEKDEQILQLKEEVADLKTLVRVLEDDNTRLKSSQPAPIDFDLGLEV
ncbi:MAG: hypothetical protein HC883_03970 [Bdellovibrionaceae bacterium]|nr:hypothetical protein [Pseudobdellovibrionaceae bacterium]